MTWRAISGCCSPSLVLLVALANVVNLFEARHHELIVRKPLPARQIGAEHMLSVAGALLGIARRAPVRAGSVAARREYRH